MTAAAVICCAGLSRAETSNLSWPEETNVTRPWAFWHWFGNAVDKTNITTHLEEYNRAGFGGMMVIGLQECLDPKAVSVLRGRPMILPGSLIICQSEIKKSVDQEARDRKKSN